CGISDVIDVAGAQAFLAGCGPRKVEFADPQKLVLDPLHPCRREQDGLVSSWNEHVAGTANTALALEERQIFFAQLVGFHQISKPQWSRPWPAAKRGFWEPPNET